MGSGVSGKKILSQQSLRDTLLAVLKKRRDAATVLLCRTGWLAVKVSWLCSLFEAEDMKGYDGVQGLTGGGVCSLGADSSAHQCA